MKRLSIRFYLILALALIAIVAILSSCATDIMLTYNNQQSLQHSTLLRSMVSSNLHWTDPAWQKTISSKFSASDMALVLRNADGQLIYQTGSYNPASPIYQEVLVTDGTTHPLGTASIYECTSAIVLAIYTVYIGLFALLLTLAGVVWFFASIVLKPLDAIKKATQQVTQNDLDFHFPKSRVREVAEAFHSFTMMGEALHTSLLRQAEIEQERRLLISSVAHDLRTPLFSLRGYLEGLSLGLANTPEKAARYIEVCQNKAIALERLVADLFSYTQVEYLEQMPHQEPFEVGELIDHVLESLQPQTQSRNVAFSIERPSVPCIIEADLHLLTRVFENLLDNALRYTPIGSSIHIDWRSEDDHLIFSITDMGQGIAPADLPHLFTPLYRGEPSRSRRTGGAGLGLAIAQRILRAHGGDLTATNAAHAGAVFTGSLSISRTQEKVDRMVSGHPGVVNVAPTPILTAS
jgi:signal transduction histidine kinase